MDIIKNLDKINNTPEKVDKEISAILASNNMEEITSLFFCAKSKKFYKYLMAKDYILYFNTEEIKPLLKNYNFIDYLYKVNFPLFNSIKEEDYTNELIDYIIDNIYSFINSDFNLFNKSKLINNINIAKIIIDSALIENDYVEIINNVKNNSIYKLIVKQLVSNGIKLDPALINSRAFENLDIASYFVLNIDLENIKYVKGYVYEILINNISVLIRDYKIDLSEYKEKDFPLDLININILKSISENKKYYFLLKYFPDYLFNYIIDYNLFENVNDDTKLKIINKNKCNGDFFKVYLANLNEDTFKYFNIFNLEAIKTSLEDIISEYIIKDNKYMRNLILNDDKFICTNKIYNAVIEKENDPEILDSYISKIDANFCDNYTFLKIYELIKNHIIDMDCLNKSFYDNNKFLNFNMENDCLIDINKFTYKAYILNKKSMNEETLVNNLLKSTNLIVRGYGLSYINYFSDSNYGILTIEKNYMKLLNSNLSKKDKELIIYLLETQKRNPKSIENVTNEKEMYAFLNFGDILNKNTKEFINCINFEQLKCINSKHIRTIYNLLKQYMDEDAVLNLSIKMYLTLGFDISNDLLLKKYGDINQKQINTILKNININNVTFAMEEKSFTPIINKELINIIFGNNYKISYTPIKIFLNNFEDKGVSTKYINEISTFFYINIGQAFQKWNLIKEEYLRKINNSKLETRLNISMINEIINYINKIRPLLVNVSDIALKQSDVLIYAGIDNQYVIDYKQIPSRIVTLSRYMDNVDCKTIPNISFNYDGYRLNSIGPKDRNMLSFGYKVHDCFRPMGVADNYGNNGSLLEYVCSTKYATCIEILDSNNKLVCFSPVYRNGNVLLINSLEGSKLESKKLKIMYEMLNRYSKEIFQETRNNKDNIEYVMITEDGDNFKKEYTQNFINNNERFHLYDPKCKFSYAKINESMNILSVASNAKGIKYDYETKDYYYENSNNSFINLKFDESELKIINKLMFIKNKIINLSNDRFRTSNEEMKYKNTEKIEKGKDEYLHLYNEYINEFGFEKLEQYQLLLNVIKRFYSDIPNNIKESCFSDYFYIVVLDDDSVLYEFEESHQQECIELLDKIRKGKDNARSYKKI